MTKADKIHSRMQALISENARLCIEIQLTREIIEKGADYEPSTIHGEYAHEYHDQLLKIVRGAK